MGSWNGVELNDLTLRSSRLTLRRWEPADADAVLAAASTDPWMREFLPIPVPYTRVDAVTFVTDLGHEGRAEGTGAGFAVVEISSGRVAGGVGLRLPGPHRRCDIGYTVYPWARGHGYAAEAADALARWAFATGVSRVEIHCVVRNLASAKTAMAAGFTFETVMRDGLPARSGFEDAALFARLAADSGVPVAPVLRPLPADGLSDGVIGLRVIAPADAQMLIEEHNDPISMSWGFDDKPADPASLTAAAAAAELQWLVGPIGRLAIVDLASGQAAGSVQLRKAGPPQVMGIGYAVHPAFRGQGFTTRALRLLADWAFGPGDLERLELGAKVANVASQKAALHAGFLPDGVRTARLRNPDGTFSDEARFFRCR